MGIKLSIQKQLESEQFKQEVLFIALEVIKLFMVFEMLI